MPAFEEITAEDVRSQVETNLFGPLNATRAVLSVMRARRWELVCGDLLTATYAASP